MANNRRDLPVFTPGQTPDHGPINPSDIPVLGIIAMPEQARGASFNAIEATINDPRNAARILHGLSVMAYRQLNGLTPIDQSLLAAVLVATRYDRRAGSES